MGDKGGKKDKNKGKKQKVTKQEQKAQKKQSKQQKSAPWEESRFERAKTLIPDEVRCLFTELQNNREANHAMQMTPNGAPDGWR